MKLENTFYNLPIYRQLWTQLKFAGLFIIFNLLCGSVLVSIGLWALIPFVFGFSLSIFAPFVDVPVAIKAGILVYYSPLFIGEKVKNNRLVIHGGSLFDYYFVLDKSANAKQRQRAIFVGYIDGLLNLINLYEDKLPTGITIKATSYILNARTAAKIGLQPTSYDGVARFVLYFNYFNITCMLSMQNGKLTWPDMRKAMSFEGPLDSLIAKKSELVKLRNRLV